MTVIVVVSVVVAVAWGLFLIAGLLWSSPRPAPEERAPASPPKSVDTHIDERARLTAEAAVLIQRQAEDCVATKLAFDDALKAHREGRK